MFVIVCSAVALTGCGSGALDVVSLTTSELRLSCGPVTFGTLPPAFEELPPLDPDARAALDELVNGPTGREAAGFDQDYDWSVASRTDDQLVLFGRGTTPESGAVNAQFVRENGTWTPRSWGGCNIEVDVAGFRPARVALEPDLSRSAASSELSLVINERACASGRAPTGRDVVPIVTETDETISIAVLVESTDGDADCPGNPWHPITITLEEPLGSRQLLDAHTFPPRPIGPVPVAD